MRSTVTRAGDVHLPTEVRDRLALRPGDEVELRVTDERTVVVEARPATAEAENTFASWWNQRRTTLPR